METPEQPSRAQRAAQGAGALCSKGMGRGWGKLGTCPGPSGCPQPGAGGAVGPGWSGARLRPRLLTHSAAEHPWKAAAPPRCLAAGCQGTLGASTCGDRAGDKAPQKGVVAGRGRGSAAGCPLTASPALRRIRKRGWARGGEGWKGRSRPEGGCSSIFRPLSHGIGGRPCARERLVAVPVPRLSPRGRDLGGARVPLAAR